MDGLETGAVQPGAGILLPPRAEPASLKQAATGESVMTPDTITIVVAIIGTGIALGVLIVPSLRDLHRDVADLRERMARLEGLFEGFTRREREPPAG